MSSEKRKLTPEEILAAMEESDAADEAERIHALSDEALDAELAQTGFDPKALRQRGEEIAKRAMRAKDERVPSSAGAWVAPVAVRRESPLRARWVALIAAALGAAAVIAAVAVPALLAKHIDANARVDAGTDTTVTSQLLAQKLRENAMRACQEQKWSDCIAGLNTARSIDPEGDKDADVQLARRLAFDATQPRRPPVPDTK